MATEADRLSPRIWADIYRAIQNGQNGREVFQGVVTERDSERGYVWVRELSSDPIEVVGHDHEITYIENGARKSVRVPPAVPDLGDVVTLVKTVSDQFKCVGTQQTTRKWNADPLLGLIQPDSITAREIAAGAVGNSELAPDAVTTAKIQDGTIARGDLNTSVSALFDSVLANPVLRAEFGGATTPLALGSYLCNMDSIPKAPGTLALFRVHTFRYEAAVDDPPSGYKTQWQWQVIYETNATAPACTLTWALWEITAVGGGAGGLTQTGAASFTTPTSVNVVSPSANTLAILSSGWHDHGVTGDIVSGKTYGFGVNVAVSGMAGNSAMAWTGRLFRRFVPI